jgi:hypothetical protein
MRKGGAWPVEQLARLKEGILSSTEGPAPAATLCILGEP